MPLEHENPRLRREQSPSRANLPEIEPFRLPSGRSIRKVSPLAAWSTKEIWAYARQHDIPLLPPRRRLTGVAARTARA